LAVTIKDVAKKAGVSISTVSKAIHDNPSIPAATKQRIFNAMKELNYYPNIIARSFAQQSSYHIGLIMSLNREDAFLNPYIYEILSGAEEIAKKNGYLITLINMSTVVNDCKELERLIMQKSVDGFLIHLAGFDPKLVKILKKHNFPLVYIGRPWFESSECWVDIDNARAGEIAAKHLIDSGCERIAFIGDGLNNYICKMRYEGYQKALLSSGLELKNEYAKDMSNTNIPALVDELAAMKEPPDGLVCSNNFIAFEVLKCLNKKKIRVPEDMALITFDNYPFAPYTEPKMSVVDIDVYELGIQSADILIKKLKTPALTMQCSLLSPTLVARESTRKTED